MVRKIPVRKHRGVRDPLKQNAERLKALKGKINAPPTNKDEQDIPKSLVEIMKLKEKVKSGEISLKRKRNRKAKQPKPVSVKPAKIFPGEKPIPGFTQRQGESNQRFVERVHEVCQATMKETAFEAKYGIKVKYNSKTREVEGFEKKPLDELEQHMKKVKKEEKGKGKKKKKKKNKDGEEKKEKVSKSKKWALKVAERKGKKEEREVDEFKSFKDSVKFGEIVHAPPTLVKPRKVKNETEAPRPGKKNLLLKSMLDGKTDKSPTQKNRKIIEGKKSDAHKTSNKAIDKKGKRKNLPAATRRQLDKQQNEIIQAYKELKKKRQMND